jgi:hypothetical protein
MSDVDELTNRVTAHVTQVIDALGPAPTVSPRYRALRSRRKLRPLVLFGLVSCVLVAVGAVRVALGQSQVQEVVATDSAPVFLLPPVPATRQANISPAPRSSDPATINLLTVFGDASTSLFIIRQHTDRTLATTSLQDQLAAINPAARAVDLRWFDEAAGVELIVGVRYRTNDALRLDIRTIVDSIRVDDGKIAGSGVFLPIQYAGTLDILSPPIEWTIHWGDLPNGGTGYSLGAFGRSSEAERVRSLMEPSVSVPESRTELIGERLVTIDPGTEIARSASWEEGGTRLTLAVFQGTEGQLIEAIGSLRQVSQTEFDATLRKHGDPSTVIP